MKNIMSTLIKLRDGSVIMYCRPRRQSSNLQVIDWDANSKNRIGGIYFVHAYKTLCKELKEGEKSCGKKMRTYLHETRKLQNKLS